MTQTLIKYDRYLTDFDAFEDELVSSSPVWVRDLRRRGLSRFEELGFPTARRGNEKWKYTNVAPIANAVFGYPLDVSDVDAAEVRRVAPWHDGWINLVFVDGHYSEALSTPPGEAGGVRARSLAEAIRSDGELVEQHLARYAPMDDDGFTALNTAFLWDGAFVHVPDGVTLDAPLHLLFVSTEREELAVSHPRALVVAGSRSKATIIESYVGLGQNRYFSNAVSEMVLEQGAEVEHYRLLHESNDAFHVGVARVRQAEGSIFTSTALEKGAGLGRYDLDVLLDGPNSTCTLRGLYITTGSQHVDNFINIDHAKPYATSRLFYKGILDGKSRAVFGGTVWVRPGAIKTDAKQEDKNLVLSPDAEVDSKPALFIFADDVKCGHGAAAGNIDENMVFYLRSRGLDLETASRFLIYGFASQIIDTVAVDEFRAYLEKLFLDSLPSYKFEF
jgi:Fe-S cluster assembly protein SufD